MYTGDISQTNLDQFSHPNLFNLSESQNIWSTNDKSFVPTDSLFNQIRQKNMFNNSSYINPSIVSERSSKPRKAAASERRDTNLIVNYLPDGFYEKDLYDLFSKAGPIAHYHVVRNKENRSECYGFVDFEKALDAERAIEMFHQFQIQNKKLKVQNAYEGLLIKQEEKERTEKGLNNLGYNVEIRNAPLRWTVNEVKNIFGKYGEILKVYENASEESSTIENPEIRSKTFHVIFRYQTIATKVVKKKHKQYMEPLWPLDLELTLVGQEFVDVVPEPRCRSRNSKPKFDQLSEASFDTKFTQLEPKTLMWDEKYGLDVNYWSEETVNGTVMPLSVNGRPILKHNNDCNESFSDPFFKTMSDVNSKPDIRCPIDATFRMGTDQANLFQKRTLLHDSTLKNIWEPKDSRNPIPSDIYVKTPLIPYLYPNPKKTKFKANIWLKMENTQPTGSFKLRGMAQVLYKAKWDNVGMIVSSSGGNAGLAVAYTCNILKLRCSIVVPVTTSASIIELMTRNNAQVIQEGANWQEAHCKAELIRDSYPGLCRLVHPFDDPLLWHGYESIVDEIIEDMNGKKLDLIVCAVGGGGLLNGIAQGISKHNLNKQTAILAMETEGTACFNKSMYAEEMLTIVPEGVATSLGASKVSHRSMEIFKGQEHHLFSMICSDAEAVDSCIKFIYEHNTVVEPACGAALSTIYNGYLEEMAECRTCDLNVVVVVCGGRCTDIDNLFQMRQMMMQQQQQHQHDFLDLHQNRQQMMDINIGRLNALDISNNSTNSSLFNSQNNSNSTQVLRPIQDISAPVTSNEQYFFSNTTPTSLQQQQQSLTKASQSITSTPASSFTYSSIASKNLAPIREQATTLSSSNNLNKSNILSVHANSNRNTIDSNMQQCYTGINNKMTTLLTDTSISNNNHSNSLINNSILAGTGTNNSNNSNMTPSYVPYSSSSDMIASPVGSQHSDKENRF